MPSPAPTHISGMPSPSALAAMSHAHRDTAAAHGPPAPSVRTIVLRAGDNYYTAASRSTTTDYGPAYSPIQADDFYFNTSVRWLVLARLRREVRNNPYLAGMVNRFPGAVGTPTLRSRTKSRDYNDLKDAFWYRATRRVTTTGLSLRALSRIILRELLIAGEIFLIKLADGRLQPIPSEYCGSPFTTTFTATATENARTDWPAGVAREVNGILYDDAGQPAHYRFGKLSSSGQLDFSQTTLVAAAHVLHIYERDAVHMGRGLPWLLPSLQPARDLFEITAAKTKQIKDVSSIFGTIEKINAREFLESLNSGLPPLPSIPDGSGESTASGAAGEPANTASASARAPANTASASARDPATPHRIELRPGTFIGLEPNEKLNVLSSKYEAADYKELVMLMLHAIATPIGFSVELWFSGLGDVNYSGFKGLGVQWDSRRKEVAEFQEESFLDPYHDWRIPIAKTLGELPANPDEDDSLIAWLWRRTAVLDEEKAHRANSSALASGEKSLADVWEANGDYEEEVFERRRQTYIKMLLASGKLEEDPTGEYKDVIVPLCWLQRNLLEGQGAGVPHDPKQPDATDDDPAAPAATPGESDSSTKPSA